MTVIAIVGPTAAGKSAVAIEVAARLGGTILSVDSMQVYREMDIGTAKPTAADQARAPHRLIDLVDCTEEFSVAEFQATGVAELDVLGDGLALVVGGSGLHFRALVDPLDFPPTDPTLRSELEASDPFELVARLLAADDAAGDHVDLANPRRVLRAIEILELTGETPTSRSHRPSVAAVRSFRPRLPLVAIGLDPGPALESRVKARLDAMLAGGLATEVAALAPRLGRTAAQAVGYKQLLPFVRNEIGLDAARNEALRATLGLAKRQRTFFRKDPRIRWLAWHDDPTERARAVRSALEEAGVWTS